MSTRVRIIEYQQQGVLMGLGMILVNLLAVRVVDAYTQDKEAEANRKIFEQNRLIEEDNRKNKIGEHEYMRLFAWAIGEGYLATFDYLTYGKTEAETHRLIISLWNNKHGNTLKLYDGNPFSHNLGQIANLWVTLGKP